MAMKANPEKAMLPVTRAELGDFLSIISVSMTHLMEAAVSTLNDDKKSVWESLQEAVDAQRKLIEKFDLYIGEREDE